MTEERREALQGQEQISQLRSKLEAAKKVKELFDTAGWKEIAAPTLERMVRDIIGGKISDEKGYDAGGIFTFKDKPVEFYLGYKQALCDFYNRLLNYVNHIQKISDAIVKAEEQKVRGDVKPMEGSPYYPEV